MNTDDNTLNAINDGIAKYTVKDSVFTDLFKDKKYTLMLIRLFIMKMLMLQKKILNQLPWKMSLWQICIMI